MWLALKTRSRHEAVASLSLAARGWETFLPTCPTRRRWSDRVKVVHLPLFPGYLFLRPHSPFLRPVLDAPGVTSFVSFGGRPAPIPDAEIEALQRLAASGLAASDYPFPRAGDRVRIRAGSLEGVEGLLLKVRNQWRLVLRVELLQRAVSVEIDRELVEPLPQGNPFRLAPPPEFLMVAS